MTFILYTLIGLVITIGSIYFLIKTDSNIIGFSLLNETIKKPILSELDWRENFSATRLKRDRYLGYVSAQKESKAWASTVLVLITVVGTFLWPLWIFIDIVNIILMMTTPSNP
jgi:hypothetical protein